MEPSTIVTIKRYAKFVVAAAGVVGLVAKNIIEGDLTTASGLIEVGGAIAVALGVRQVPNLRP